jgi:hypothetical protein
MKTPLRFSVLSSFCFLSLGFTLAPARAQTTRFVSTTSTNTNPASATSWATSTTNLQGAIDAAGITEVWVAAGVYKPGGNANTNRTISFAMKNGVAIYGGFVGSETLLSQRPAINPVARQPSSTTLSGDLMGDDTPNLGNRTDNSFNVIRNPSNLTTSAVLDGFVITGGNNERYDGVTVYGAAIHNSFSSPTIRNCSVIDNRAIYSAAIYNAGGRPVLTNCSFQSNWCSYEGGAIYNSGSNPVVTNCSFQNNRAEIGTALYNIDSSPVLTNCSFLSNTATFNGGVLSNSTKSNPVLINCVAWDNGGSKTFYNDDRYGANTITARYSLFEPSVTGYISDPTNLTTTSSPFVSANSVALNVCSPAINAGSNSATGLSGITTDLAGQPRIFNGPGTPDRIDMGAVEFQAAPNLLTVTITFPNSVTVPGVGLPGSPVPIVRVPALNPPVVFQASGGSSYERLIIMDRINGYEIRQNDSNNTGIFPITRLGLFTLTVRDVSGCSRTVQWVVEQQ